MLKNKSLGVDLNVDILELKSLKDKTLGAIKFKNHALFFETRFGIHTFWVDKKMDIIVLDSKNKVSKLKANLLPNRVFFWNPIFSRILELPAGSIEKLKLEVGSIIEFDL